MFRELPHDQCLSQVAPVRICIAPGKRTVCASVTGFSKFLRRREFMYSNQFYDIAFVFNVVVVIERAQAYVCLVIKSYFCSNTYFPRINVVRFTLLSFYKPEFNESLN